MEDYSKYLYDGPVMIFDKLVEHHWKGETMAPSENKARSNLAYQFKKRRNLGPRANVSLPGELLKIN